MAIKSQLPQGNDDTAPSGKVVSVSVEDTDLIARDRYRINKKPGYLYRCAENDPARVQELQLMGYTVCTEETTDGVLSVQTTPDTKPSAPPGLIWMRIPEDLAKKRDAMKDARSKRQEQDVKQTISDFKRVASMGRGSKQMGAMIKLLSERVDDRDLEELDL
uniref:Uncharacterized protein n=1 Tax=viral metagenome TaxID=1070528 RepID=A0A6M3IL50_9ZZZZ